MSRRLGALFPGVCPRPSQLGPRTPLASGGCPAHPDGAQSRPRRQLSRDWPVSPLFPRPTLSFGGPASGFQPPGVSWALEMVLGLGRPGCHADSAGRHMAACGGGPRAATHLGWHTPWRLHTWAGTHLSGHTHGRGYTWVGTHLDRDTPGQAHRTIAQTLYNPEFDGCCPGAPPRGLGLVTSD